ncbi:MAG TPA: hypothetical protein VGR29_02005 [Thermomicrobiales bacterium]|nr:hypothetical protein [Thermomicrobiales bacterium]
MKRPHASDDVRERALAAIDEGRSVADGTAFSRNDPSTIRRWMRMRQRTGSWRIQPRSGGLRRISPAQEAALRAQVFAHPDATLAEHCARWEAMQGMRVGVATMGRALRRPGLTRNKRP